MAEKKEYSNPYRSLEAIWAVLRTYASKTHPLSVREIERYLKAMADAPSRATLDRLLPREQALWEELFPGVISSADDPEAVAAYAADRALHVVVETPEGELLHPDARLEYTVEPFRAPSYSTLDKLLKSGIPFDMDTFPYQNPKGADANGKTQTRRRRHGAQAQRRSLGGPHRRRP